MKLPRPGFPAPTELGDDPRTWPWLYRWLLFLIRATIIALVAWIAGLLPLPIVDDWLPAKNVLIACAAIMLIGKALFDTLFFDRHWP